MTAETRVTAGYFSCQTSTTCHSRAGESYLYRTCHYTRILLTFATFILYFELSGQNVPGYVSPQIPAVFASIHCLQGFPKNHCTALGGENDLVI